MFGSLFRKRKKRAPTPEAGSLGDSVKDARVGDVFTITGLSVEYDDSYFIVEKLNRYESASGEWHEILGADGEKKLWVQWSGDGGLFVTANADAKPLSLNQVGVTEDELIRMDDEHSIDNHIDYEGVRFSYRNSSEAAYYQDNRGEGEGYYLWEFTGEEKVLSIDKWEGMPFQAFVSDVVSPESITVYKR